MTKTEKILDLTKRFPNLTSFEIAERVGCHHAYVRTAWHRHGIFRRKHNPSIEYQRAKFKRILIEEYKRLVAAAAR